MNDKILRQLMDIFRDEPTTASQNLLLALMLIAWHQASQNPRCPSDLHMQNCQGIKGPELIHIMAELSKAMHDPAFNPGDSGMARLSPSAISAAMNWCLHMGQSGFLAQFDPTDAVLSVDQREMTGFPEEVCDFMVGLAGDLVNKTVYLPWESNGQLAGRLLRKQAVAMIETNWYADILQLVLSIVTGSARTGMMHNDPLRHPGYLEAGHLKTFGTTLALLPFSVNIEAGPEIVDRDLFGRFKEKTRSLTVLAVRHILAQTRGRAVVTVINGLLFGSGAERNLREDLLAKRQIVAVVAMPPGLLSMTTIPFTIMVLDTERPCHTVRFVNADTPSFKESVLRTRSRLINLEQLVDVVLASADSDIARSVRVEEILANDSQLQVNRYVLGASEQKVASLLASMPLRRLDELATLVKPVANVPAEQGMAVYEVGASDLPDYGYIHTASKQILIEPRLDKMKDQFLRHGDIVLIIKGSLGKVGIIGPGAPPAGENGWIAGQSAVVIRLEKASAVNPVALFILLRSELGKGLVRKLASGSAITFVQLRELKQLAIPVPSREESDKAIAALAGEEDLQRQINLLQQRQASLAAHCWSLDHDHHEQNGVTA